MKSHPEPEERGTVKIVYHPAERRRMIAERRRADLAWVKHWREQLAASILSEISVHEQWPQTKRPEALPLPVMHGGSETIKPLSQKRLL
jgi:hypothetical protein